MSSTHDPKRRILLLGGLAAGCALCMRTAAAAEKVPDKLGETKSAKISKIVAKYQDKPNGNQKCANCGSFIAPDTCKVVEGTVSPNGWCMLNVPKAV